MANKRRTPTENEQKILFLENNGFCPECNCRLYYDKNGRIQKNYEMAHIYPLNPSQEEKEDLKGVEKLNENRNSIDNFILLCPSCHNKFDKPRTRNEYEKFLNIKKMQIKKRKAKEICDNYPIEQEIKKILNSLACIKEEDLNITIEYSTKKVIQKLEGENFIFIRAVKDDVSQYYQYIQNILSELDNQKPGTFEQIAIQFNALYKKLKLEKYNKKEIYDSLCDWQHSKLDGISLNFSLDACRIITSFFIQNCEVFE